MGKAVRKFTNRPYMGALMHGAQLAWNNRKELWKAGKTGAQIVKGVLKPKKKPPVYRRKRKYDRGLKLAADDLHSAKATSKHHVVLGKPNKKAKLHGHFIYQQQNAELYSSFSGQQSIGSLSIDMTSPQLGVQGSIANPTPNDYYNNLMSFNPNLRATGDVAGFISQGNVMNVTRLHVKKIKYEIQIVNGSSHATDVVLYMVVPKKGGRGNQWVSAGWVPTTAGCLTDMNAIISRYPGSTNAVQAQDTGVLDVNPVFGKTNSTIFGFSPFQLQAFRKEWKCLMKKEINLAGGAIHKLEITVDVHKTFDQEYLYDQYTNGNYALPYKTIQIFSIQRGSPVIVRQGDNSLPTAENSPVTTSAAYVGFTINKKIHASFTDAVLGTKVDYVIPSFRNLVGTAQEKEIDAVDDQHTVAHA